MLRLGTSVTLGTIAQHCPSALLTPHPPHSRPWIQAYLNAARAVLRARFHPHQLTELEVGMARTREWNTALNSAAAEPVALAFGSPLVGAGATLAILGIGSPYRRASK
jgi:hypothetical protein